MKKKEQYTVFEHQNIKFFGNNEKPYYKYAKHEEVHSMAKHIFKIEKGG